MVAAAAAIVAIGAAGAIAQYYQAEKQRKADAKRLAEIRAMFEGIVPPDADVSIEDPPELINERVPPESLAQHRVDPIMIKQLEKYIPEIAATVKEQNPQLIERSQAATQGFDAQRSALEEIINRSRSDVDPELAGRYQQAAKEASRTAGTQIGNIQELAARRGQLGSGTMLASQLSASEGAASRQADIDRQLAMEAYRNKLGLIAQSGQLGRQLSQDELGLAGQNADIINQFNARIANRAQQQENMRAGTMNEAGLYNINQAQRISEANIGNMNQANREAYQRALDERAYQNQLRQYEGQWRQGQKEYANNQRQQRFENEMARTSGAAGAGYQGIASGQQAAAQRASAMQGVTQAGMAGATMYGSQSNAEADREAKADEAAKQRQFEAEQNAKYGKRTY